MGTILLYHTAQEGYLLKEDLVRIFEFIDDFNDIL